MAVAPVGMAVLDLDRRFVEVNAALCRIFGRDPDWFLTRRIADVLDPLDNEADLRMRAEVLSGRADYVTWEQRIQRPDDTPVWVEHSVALLVDADPGVTFYISQFVDISEAKASTDQLRYQATHDALTRVANRRDLLDRIGVMLSHQHRGEALVAVLFVDIDHLKVVNDTYGHSAGDDAIVAIAQRITEQVRATDDATRFGGDEFIVVLADDRFPRERGTRRGQDHPCGDRTHHDRRRGPPRLGEHRSVRCGTGRRSRASAASAPTRRCIERSRPDEVSASPSTRRSTIVPTDTLRPGRRWADLAHFPDGAQR